MSLPDRLDGPGLEGLWRRAWRAMAKAGDGWAAVTIRVPLAGDDERHALAGLLGRPVRPGTASASVVLADLDAAVRRRGDGWDLRSVVEARSGPVPNRRGEAEARGAAIDAAVAAARSAGPGEAWFEPWLAGLRSDGTLARLAGRSELDLLRTAARVLAALPLVAEPLPSLASRLTGDTKALSGGSLAGLVLSGIGASAGEAGPVAGAAARRARWESAGVVPDDLASQVLVLNLPVEPAPGVAGWLAEAADGGLPFRVTLHQVASCELPVRRDPGPVYVCENPAVLRAAAERLGSASAPLVCTEGQPSVAADRVFAALSGAGAELRVRADFDWPGLRIGGRLLTRPGTVPWRFGRADYEAAFARQPASSPALAGLAVPSPWDPALAEAMARAGRAVYEEELLDVLLGDLDRGGPVGPATPESP